MTHKLCDNELKKFVNSSIDQKNKCVIDFVDEHDMFYWLKSDIDHIIIQIDDGDIQCFSRSKFVTSENPVMMSIKGSKMYPFIKLDDYAFGRRYIPVAQYQELENLKLKFYKFRTFGDIMNVCGYSKKDFELMTEFVNLD